MESEEAYLEPLRNAKPEDFSWMLESGNQAFFKKLNPILFHLNQKIIEGTIPKIPSEQKHHAFIIIGPPRCGSTIISQILSSSLDVSYVNNFIARFWMAPVIGAILWKQFNIKVESSYQSLRGSTHNLGDPNEFNYFWRRFFPLDKTNHYSDNLCKEKFNLLRNEISGLITVFDKPFLFKYVFGSQKIEILSKVITKVKFIVIRREPLYIAQSLLKIRKQVYNDINKWWSLKPKEYEIIAKKDPYEQVVAQVFYTYKEIDRQKKKNPNIFVELNYEQFLRSTDTEITRIANELGVKIKQKYHIPKEKLKLSMSKQISPEEFEKIKKYCSKYFGTNI